MLRLNLIVPALLVVTCFTITALFASVDVSHAEMPHNRRCDIAQDNPGNLNPGGGSAIMFGLCSGIDDLPTGESPSRHHTWNAFNCGYQGYRQGKLFGANPYYNDELETRWSEGWTCTMSGIWLLWMRRIYSRYIGVGVR
jgi:hypothetical protein